MFFRRPKYHSYIYKHCDIIILVNIMAVWGYARVSSKDQNLDRQIEVLRPLVTTQSHLIIEKSSGKNFDRPKWQALKEIMRENDTLIVKSLDRLGRNYQQIKTEWAELSEKKIYIQILDMPLLDTSKYVDNDLMAQFTSNLVLEILSFVAENERRSIKQRQQEGIRIAKENGVKFGRPQMPFPDEWEYYYTAWKEKKITAKQAMECLNLKKATFYNLVKRYKK